MAYPTFSKTGMTTLTFARGQVFPDEYLFNPGQLIGYSEAGQVRVATLSDPEEIVPLLFERLPQSDVDTLVAWLRNPLINWAANTFTYTDTTSVAMTVRMVDRSFVRQQVASGLYDVRLTLRKELF